MDLTFLTEPQARLLHQVNAEGTVRVDARKRRVVETLCDFGFVHFSIDVEPDNGRVVYIVTAGARP
jgi:hypothetical protein